MSDNNFKKTLNETIHFLQKARVVMIAITYFICYLTWDFHEWYKLNAASLPEYALVAVGAYAAALWGCIKLAYDHISKPIERDQD